MVLQNELQAALNVRSPGVTEPTLALRCRANYRHASAAPLAGLVSFATAPLHFTSISQAPFPFHSFRRSQTAETGTDSVAPGDSGIQRPRCSAYRPVSNMAARLRPAKASALRREASPIAEDSGNNRGDDPAFAALRRLRLRNWPTPLEELIGLILRRQAAGRSAERAHVAIASPTTPSALPSKSQIHGFALARLAGIVAATTQVEVNIAARLA